MVDCSVARVTFLNVTVSKGEDFSFFGEPGASAEWDMVFTAGGQQQRRRIDGVRDGSVLGINIPLIVDLAAVSDELLVSVSGVELDDSSANDPLPLAQHRVIPKENWAEGQQFTASASNEDFSYSFDFKIECAEATGTTAQGLTAAPKVIGDIRAKWAALGAEHGFLGFPLTDELTTPDGIGRYNHFQGGSIYWTPDTGAHEVHGAIRQAWADKGWERSVLGYPISDEEDAPGGGRQSRFQGGRITWTPAGGAVIHA